jgi:CheY-like chemotaxis protein
MHALRIPESRPVPPIASAVVLQDQNTAGPFSVETLSPDGATLRGLWFGNLSLGKATVLLCLPGGDLIRVSANIGQAEWWDGQILSLAVAFADLASEIEDQIQGVVAKYIERSGMPMIVVLDDGSLETPEVRRAFHTLGREVVFLRNPLETLLFLERFADACSTILIDQSFVRANGPESLAFLHDRFSAKRRVLVVPQLESEAGKIAAMAWSVHGVLTTPWTFGQLEAALGLLPARASKRPKRILFVDDEPAVLSGLQNRLRKYLGSYETVWVTSGEVALAESQARPFDVVVTDLRMPGMDGVMLLRAIKDHAPRAKRVVLTGWDTHPARDVADIVLRKPCSVDQLRLEVLGPTR